MSLFGKHSDAALGVDIGSNGIKLVEMKKAKGRPQLWTYGILDEQLDIHPEAREDAAPKDLLHSEAAMESTESQKKNKTAPPPVADPRVKKYAEMLKHLVKETKAHSRIATASLPVSEVFHTVITLPKVDKKKDLLPIVRAEVKKFISRPIDEMQIMHQLIPEESDKYSRVLATAAPRSVIQFFTAIFQQAGLELKELETEAFAIERSLVGRDKTTAVVVDIGAQRTNFFIMSRGLPITHRSIQLGGDMITEMIQRELSIDARAANQIKRDISRMKNLGGGEIFHSLLTAITKEVKYSMDLFTNQTTVKVQPPEKIILTGGSSVFPLFAETLSTAFNMRVFVGDPWARVVYQQGLKQTLDKIAPRMSVSIGLALRNMV